MGIKWTLFKLELFLNLADKLWHLSFVTTEAQDSFNAYFI